MTYSHRRVDADVRFTRANIAGQNTLLGVVYVQRNSTTLPAEEIRAQLTAAIHTRLRAQGFNVTPLIDVNVLEAPAENQSDQAAPNTINGGMNRVARQQANLLLEAHEGQHLLQRIPNRSVRLILGAGHVVITQSRQRVGALG